ncbi:MAG TPA: MMPL family transporter [Solirubrobacteraceae bacterium]|nr:MMPL family transporter [Solirubrobacteraceae bacterium]
MPRFSIDRTFETVARTIVRFRWLVVVLWLLAAVVVSGAFPSLGSEVNNDNSAFLPASAPSSRAANLAAPLLGSSKTGYILVVGTRASALTPDDLAAVSREAAAAREVDGVLAVQGPVLSADGHAAQLRVRIEAARNDISSAKAIIASLQGTFGRVAAPAGLQFHAAGQIATAVANQASSNRSGNEIQLFSILFIVVLLLFVFRAPLAAVITLLPAGLALLISTRVIGELGAHGLKISSITQVLLIVLLLGAGTDYGLFLVFRVREELRNGHEGQEAVVRALVRVGESISASAGTVILALLTLLLASFGLYHDLGLPLAVGMAVMLAIGLTLLPALLAIFGRAVFWPVRIEPGPQREGLWGRIAARLVRRPALTLGFGLVLFLALAAAALGFSSSGFGGATSAPSGTDAAAGNAALAAHFPQTSSNPANLVLAYRQSVWQNPQPIVRASDSLRSSGRFTALSGPLNPNGTSLTPARLVALHAELGAPGRLPVREPAGVAVPRAEYDAYRAVAQFVSADGRIVQFAAALRAGGQQSTQAMNATPAIRDTVAAAALRSGAVESGVAGEAAALHDISTTANHDLRLIVPIAVLAIGLLLALVLRSLAAPLYLIVSVVLSYLAALGVATLAFITIGGDSGISFILPFLMFVFLFALGEDYNILVMTRIREEARSLPLRDAVVRAVGRTGSTVTSAGLILGGTFIVLTVASSGAEASQVRAIGLGLAAGILMDTFLVRTLLVPATVILLGQWTFRGDHLWLRFPEGPRLGRRAGIAGGAEKPAQ